DDGIIAHLHVAGHLHGVHHDAVVAHDAVVRNVRIGHDQAVAAHHGLHLIDGAAADGHAFSDHGVVTDDGGRLLAGELQVLRHRRDNGSRIYFAVLANAGAFHDGHV